MVEVSIIIPNWNGGDVFAECLESILVHTRGVTFEIVVVDNGSDDRSVAAAENLAASGQPVRVVQNERNVFFARACNQGLEVSVGDAVLVANNDVALRDDAVTALMRYAKSQPHVGAVTPRFIDPAGQPQEFVRRLPNARRVLAHYHPVGRAIDRFFLGGRLHDEYFYCDRSFEGVEEIEQAGASFSLFQRAAIESAGGLFDERFPLIFNDVDLYRRMADTGFASHVLPDVRVVHYGGVASRQMPAGTYRDFFYDGMFEYFAKHLSAQVPLLALAWPRRFWRWQRRRHSAPAIRNVGSTR